MGGGSSRVPLLSRARAGVRPGGGWVGWVAVSPLVTKRQSERGRAGVCPRLAQRRWQPVRRRSHSAPWRSSTQETGTRREGRARGGWGTRLWHAGREASQPARAPRTPPGARPGKGLFARPPRRPSLAQPTFPQFPATRAPPPRRERRLVGGVGAAVQQAGAQPPRRPRLPRPPAPPEPRFPLPPASQPACLPLPTPSLPPSLPLPPPPSPPSLPHLPPSGYCSEAPTPPRCRRRG